MEAIILAGGLGTRLRSVIGEALPKCMAHVAGRPFLHYLFKYLEGEGCTRIVLSLGHGHAHILDWLGRESPTHVEVAHVIEHEPLGTGGGIRLAMKEAHEEHVIVLNGDTAFDVRLGALKSFAETVGAETTLALKPMRDFARYGTVEVDKHSGRILRFAEKQPRSEGLINGGIYCIQRDQFLARPLPQKFSFEKDYLEAFLQDGHFYGQASDSYFIDIGIPEDYARAQTDFAARFPLLVK
jgi:D-glycero-alpha-D-manno-heptose 1-phosphate guanylyltransferase